MPQTIEFEGQTHEFPDSFNDQDIAKALGSHNSTPPNTSAPALPTSTLPPLNSQWDATKFGVGQAATGAYDALKGMVQAVVPDSLESAKQAMIGPGGTGLGGTIIKRLMEGGKGLATQATQIPSALKDIAASPSPLAALSTVGPHAGGEGIAMLATAEAPKILGKIPLKSNAVKALKSIGNVGPQSPVPVGAVTRPLQEILAEHAAGGGPVPQVIQKYLDRISQGPAPYAEARRFYSNASRISTTESMGLSNNMKRLLGDFRQGLHEDIVSNRNQYGLGDQYQQALKEYHQAASANEKISAIGKLAAKSAAVSAGGYGGYKLMQIISGDHGR